MSQGHTLSISIVTQSLLEIQLELPNQCVLVFLKMCAVTKIAVSCNPMLKCLAATTSNDFEIIAINFHLHQ